MHSQEQEIAYSKRFHRVYNEMLESHYKAMSTDSEEFEGGSKSSSPRRGRRSPGKSPGRKTAQADQEDMEDYIKDKFARASTMKRKNKEFVGLAGTRNPDNIVNKMVDKIVKEQLQFRNSQQIGRNSSRLSQSQVDRSKLSAQKMIDQMLKEREGETDSERRRREDEERRRKEEERRKREEEERRR